MNDVYTHENVTSMRSRQCPVCAHVNDMYANMSMSRGRTCAHAHANDMLVRMSMCPAFAHVNATVCACE